MANLIAKSDIKDYVQFSDNIENRMVNNHISNVQNFMVEPLIDSVMWTNIQEILTNPSHSFPELETFYEDYIKGWVCFLVAYEIYVWHGANITQYGVRVMNEDTSVPIDPNDRAALLQNIKNLGNAAYNRMRKQLDVELYTFDSVAYNDVCKKDRGNRTQIGRIGIPIRKNYLNSSNLDRLCPYDC